MNSKRHYPKKKINYQTNDFVRNINLKKINHDKWSFLKLKIPKFIKVNDQNLKFEKKWLRRRYNEELRSKQALKFYYGPGREKNFRKILLSSLNNKTRINSQEFFLQKLELRIDRLLLRSGLYNSIFEIQQSMLHNKISICKWNQIDFLFLTKPNYIIQQGDLIKIKKPITELNLDLKYFTIFKKDNFIYLLLTKQPKIDDLKFPFKVSLKEILNWGRRY